MAKVKLGDKAAGSVVKITVGGAVRRFIIGHQGLPGSMYDASCYGTWVLLSDFWTKSAMGNNGNDYKNCSIHSRLNSEFYNSIAADIRAVIKQVRIPYTDGKRSTNVRTGANGLSCKIFLLSGAEVGESAGYMNTEGARLKYFETASKAASDGWWLRSPLNDAQAAYWRLNSDGTRNHDDQRDSFGIRPAFVLPQNLLVADDGTVSVNTAPTVTISGSADLGEQSEPFSAGYAVSDEDGDTLTVTEKLDGKTTNTRTGVASGTVLTFGQTFNDDTFRRILNGSHTLEVAVSDGIESASAKTTFTKAVHKATVTLAEPLAVEGDITVAILQVSGSIPDDAVFKAEATNNALDDEPVWQDVTAEVRKGMNIIFENQTASAGAAFNFRISVERGASGEGGYIDSVSGAFQ